jgi:NAD-dependent SIR2 family protein deacetylase
MSSNNAPTVVSKDPSISSSATVSTNESIGASEVSKEEQETCEVLKGKEPPTIEVVAPAAAVESQPNQPALQNDKNEEEEDDDDDDAKLALVLQTINALESSYNIPQDIAKQAIAVMGTDVIKCYIYILANASAVGLDEASTAAAPIETCPHVQYHVQLSPEELPTPQMNVCGHDAAANGNTNGAPEESTADGDDATKKEEAVLQDSDDTECSSSENDNNWLCLHCGAVRCSQYQHGVAHYKDSLQSDPGEDEAGHCIAASLANLSVWCDACEAYVKDPVVDALVTKLKELEFGKGDELPDEEEDADEDKQHTDESDDDSDEDSDTEEDDPDDETRHVGRGVPVLFGDEGLEEVDYPFGDAPKSLADVARFIESDECQSIIILAGAGMSVASGIPDFRSAGGLYDTLRPNLLTATEVEREAIRIDPTTALEMGMFLQNPLPCLELNRPFILGTRDRLWKATLAHRFVELLHMKTGKLTRLYQQNIDGLESQCTNLPREKVIMVHGSMDEAECALCKTKSNFHGFCSLVERNIKDITGEDPKAPAISAPIGCDLCGYETMKPSIVLFRSALPQEFFHNAREDLPNVDLLIVVGTSLAVAPANSLVYRSPRSAMRLIVNREPVGYRLGIDYSEHSKRDYFAQGDIDNVLLDLVEELGWLEDLQNLCGHLPESSARVLQERFELEESSAKRQKVEES